MINNHEFDVIPILMAKKEVSAPTARLIPTMISSELLSFFASSILFLHFGQIFLALLIAYPQ